MNPYIFLGYGIIPLNNCVKTLSDVPLVLSHVTGELVDLENDLKYGTDEYCLEIFIGDDHIAELQKIICVVDHHETLEGKFVQSINRVGLISSCICLILALIVYAILPELRNTNGKILIGTMATMLFWFVVMCMQHFEINEANGFRCLFLGMTQKINNWRSIYKIKKN